MKREDVIQLFKVGDVARFTNPLAAANGEILTGTIERINRTSVSIGAWGTIGLKFRRYPINGYRRFHVPFELIEGKRG